MYKTGMIFLPYKENIMKDNIKPKGKSIQFNQNKARPEQRDDLDSRKNEEQLFKADDVTHNKKNTRNKQQKKKK